MNCANVNKAIRTEGLKFKLYKGKGYYYFMATDDSPLYVPSLYTNDINVYSINEIIQHIKKYGKG